MNTRNRLSGVDDLEKLFENDPVAAARLAGVLATSKGTPASVRAHALAIGALGDALSGTPRALARAKARLATARSLRPRARETLGRVAHAEGYTAYKEGLNTSALVALSRAAELLAPHSLRQAQVFDTTGAYFRAHGDLQRARDYLLLSARLKSEGSGAGRDASLALTYGSLGRLSLSLEQYAEAEDWFRKDIALLRSGGDTARVAGIEAQLAAALIGRGGKALGEARRILERLLRGVRPEPALRAYVCKDLARIAFARGEVDDALTLLGDAERSARGRTHAAVRLQIRLVRGRVLASRAGRPADTKRSFTELSHAFRGFQRLGLHHDVCDALLGRADLHERLGKSAAATADLEGALVVAERYLFGQEQPLARIEERLSARAPDAWARTRLRRMLGGVPEAEHSGRLGARRRELSVWTCDIRGFTAYCRQAEDPTSVVRMLDRFFEAIGSQILEDGGRIDKYVGDNVLAYFESADAACRVALASVDAVRRLNIERLHLGEVPLGIGVGIATGEVVLGNVGFSGKLEHTIIGSAVNTACRLVGVAESAQVLMDDSTRRALGRGWVIRARPRATLKGLGAIRVHELRGASRRA